MAGMGNEQARSGHGSLKEKAIIKASRMSGLLTKVVGSIFPNHLSLPFPVQQALFNFQARSLAIPGVERYR
jgi:hypothetical protein